MRSFRTWFQQQWLIALDRNSGRSVWRQPLGIGLEVPRNTAGTPVVSDGRVIISSPISKLVAAFEIKSGKVLWVHSLSSVHKGPVTVIGGDVLLGDKAGTLHLLRAANGSELGSCNAGGAFTPTGPILVGKTFIAATRDGWVHASPYVDVRKQMLMRTGRKCFAD
jgi:outer membrane protein assembly factor BamB